MCNPVAIVTAIMSMVTTVMQTQAANKQADAQEEAIEIQGSANRAALEDKAVEVTSAASLERFERKKQMQRQVATTRVAQSEGGVLFGNTALRTIATQLIGGGQDVAVIDKQRENILQQIERQKEASIAGQGVQLAGLSWTSPLMAGMQAGTAGLGAYAGAGGKFGQS